MKPALVLGLLLAVPATAGAVEVVPIVMGDEFYLVPANVDEVVLDHTPGSGLLLEAAVSGTAIAILGSKDADGVPVDVERVLVDFPGGAAQDLSLDLDDAGRLRSLAGSLGSIVLDYDAGGVVTITIYDAAGNEQAVTTATAGTGAAARALHSRPSLAASPTRAVDAGCDTPSPYYECKVGQIVVECDDNYADHDTAPDGLTVSIQSAKSSVGLPAEVSLALEEGRVHQSPKRSVTYDYRRKVLTQEPSYEAWEPMCREAHRGTDPIRRKLDSAVSGAADEVVTEQVEHLVCDEHTISACRVLESLRNGLNVLRTRLPRLAAILGREACELDDYYKDLERVRSNLRHATLHVSKRYREHHETFSLPADLTGEALPPIRVSPTPPPPPTDLRLEVLRANPDYSIPSDERFIAYTASELAGGLDLAPGTDLFFKPLDNFFDHLRERGNHPVDANGRRESQNYGCATYELTLSRNTVPVSTQRIDNANPQASFRYRGGEDDGPYTATLRVRNERSDPAALRAAGERIAFPIVVQRDFVLSTNLPPVPIIEFASPKVGGSIVAKSDVRFDASRSTDPEDSLEQLQFRWTIVPWYAPPDWTGIAFGSQPQVSASGEEGRYIVWLQVRDRNGNVGETSHGFTAVNGLTAYTFQSAGSGWHRVDLAQGMSLRYRIFASGTFMYATEPGGVEAYDTDQPDQRVFDFHYQGPGSWGPNSAPGGLADRAVWLAY